MSIENFLIYFLVFVFFVGNFTNRIKNIKMTLMLGMGGICIYSFYMKDIILIITSVLFFIIGVIIILRDKANVIGMECVQEEENSFDWLIPHTKKVIIKKGEYLFKKGDKAEKVYYIENGSLKIVEIDKVIGKGSLIGEMGLISPFHTRTASILCLEDITAYTIDNEDMLKLYYKNPKVVYKLMQLSIKRFIDNTTQFIKEKEKMESELKIAKTIQENMLPRNFDKISSRKEFNIFAVMEAAKEVGGDLYDFFFVGENKICFLVGDVSGKGIPAALFMMMAKVLLKYESISNSDPEKVIRKVNDMLIDENPNLLFVTAFMAIVDLSTGKMEYVNAGHTLPLIYKNKAKKFEYIEPKANFILGIMPEYQYEKETIYLEEGDKIFLYSDGVTEATNEENKMFGEEKLKTNLNKVGINNAKEVVMQIKEDVNEFIGEMKPFDDVTILCFEYLK